jgi:Fur family ferric uptake transcriptional regulator
MLRNTRQRSAIETVLKNADRPLNVQELQQLAARKVEHLGMATVYRTVKSMLEEEVIRKVEIPEKAPHYERADLHHHHHFYCEGCERVFEIEACPPGVNTLAPKGFTVKRHEITLYGECKSCGNE